jgi:hypothetical protein
MAGIKPFSQACLNNRQPILEVLQRAFADATHVLEIGSGTGQHAVYFAPALRHLHWQPSDRRENIAGIHAWIDEEPADNLKKPVVLDVDGPWPQGSFDGFFTANTCHIMAWKSVLNLFAGIASQALPEAVLAIYGPFKYGGEFTTPSNANFDLWLKAIAPHQGVRDFEDIVQLAADAGFAFVDDNPMPANNQLLVFKRS